MHSIQIDHIAVAAKGPGISHPPDLGSWLFTVAIIVFLKGMFEIALLWRLYFGVRRPDAALVSIERNR